MGRVGMKQIPWSKELDDKLLEEIAKGKNFLQLTVVMRMSQPTISIRLKEMGFDGLRDARKVLID